MVSFPGLTGVPTLVAAWGGNQTIAAELKAGKQLGDQHPTRSYLDGYNQTVILTLLGPVEAARGLYFAEGTTLGAVRIDYFKYRFIDQPSGWFGDTVKVDFPILVNLRFGPV